MGLGRESSLILFMVLELEIGASFVFVLIILRRALQPEVPEAALRLLILLISLR